MKNKKRKLFNFLVSLTIFLVSITILFVVFEVSELSEDTILHAILFFILLLVVIPIFLITLENLILDFLELVGLKPQREVSKKMKSNGLKKVKWSSLKEKIWENRLLEVGILIFISFFVLLWGVLVFFWASGLYTVLSPHDFFLVVDGISLILDVMSFIIALMLIIFSGVFFIVLLVHFVRGLIDVLNTIKEDKDNVLKKGDWDVGFMDEIKEINKLRRLNLRKEENKNEKPIKNN